MERFLRLLHNARCRCQSANTCNYLQTCTTGRGPKPLKYGAQGSIRYQPGLGLPDSPWWQVPGWGQESDT